MSTHGFGGTWTGAKIEALRWYLEAFTFALRRQPFELLYIDAFAGTGRYTPKRGHGEEQDGSAVVALQTPGFARYIFVDNKRRHAQELERLRGRYPHAPIDVFLGDANAHVCHLCGAINWNANRAVLFLDPYGLAVNWSTLEAIRRTSAIDVWYLFPLNGLLRQMANDPGRRDSAKDEALDRVLGTDRWRRELYRESPIGDLFGASPAMRRESQEIVSAWLKSRLGELFPYVSSPAILRLGSRTSRHGGAALYALYFLMANESPKATALASKIVTGVFKRLHRENLVR